MSFFIVLDVNIQDDHVLVGSRLSLEPRRPGDPLRWCGVDMAIEFLAIDQMPLQAQDYSFAEGRLYSQRAGSAFELKPVAVLTPTPIVRSKACMPVVVCSTQCEAEGSGASACTPIVPMC